MIFEEVKERFNLADFIAADLGQWAKQSGGWQFWLCPHCGRGGELKHIGKSSAGWCFSLHIYPDDGINCLADWQEFWKNSRFRQALSRRVGRAVQTLQ